MVTANQPDQLSPEGVANKAVDDEVGTRVDDRGKMSNMGEATNQHDRLEEGSSISTVKDIVNMKELIYINDIVNCDSGLKTLFLMMRTVSRYSVTKTTSLAMSMPATYLPRWGRVRGSTSLPRGPWPTLSTTSGPWSRSVMFTSS